VASVTGDIPQNVNFAISGPVVAEFLQANGVNYVKAPQSRQAARSLQRSWGARFASGLLGRATPVQGRNRVRRFYQRAGSLGVAEM